VFDRSPVVDLVANIVSWVDPDLFVTALGFFEVFVGTMLLFGWALRLTRAPFTLQMIGALPGLRRPARGHLRRREADEHPVVGRSDAPAITNSSGSDRTGATAPAPSLSRARAIR
jgi:hypothetical protein